MKAVRKSIIATSLFALPSLACALGLGGIDVKSGLNEPLVAEIQVLVAAPDEKDGLRVALAKPEDFANVGLDYSRLSMALEFAVVSNARGDTVIRVTSQAAVREPFLSLLVEVNWAKGRLLREYSLLLDPPVMASARRGSPVTSRPVADAGPARTEPVAAPMAAEPVAPRPTPTPEPVPPPEPVAAAPEPMRAPEPTPVAEAQPEPVAPTPEPAAPEPVAVAPDPVPAAAGPAEYGPVATGESLYQIAQKTRSDASVSVDQMMVSILRMNSQAFYQDNINALKTGAILRIPSGADLVSAAEAKAAVQEHNSLWGSYQSRASESPTLVSDSGSNSVAAESSSYNSSSDRLELAAPRSGDSQGSADRPDGRANAASAEQLEKTRGDLALAKEDLASAQREGTELRSRVTELEQLNSNKDSLVKLKDDQIAELQRKIEQLQQEVAAAPVATTPPPVAAESTPEPISTPTTPEPVATAEPVTSTEPVATVPDQGSDISKSDIWGDSLPDATTPDTTTADTSTTDGSTSSEASTTPDATTDTSSADSTGTTDLTSTPVTSEPDTTAEPIAADSTPPPDTSTETTTTPIVDTTTPAPTPVVAEEPGFFELYWPWLAGGGGVLLLLGLLAVLRKPKAAVAPVVRNDQQDDNDAPLQGFLDAEPEQAPSPYTGTPTPPPFPAFDADPEMALRSAIEVEPDNLAAHLSLLRLFYGRNDASAFEDAAQAMRARLYDTDAPEWQEAQSMGEQLVPNSSLFASTPDFGTMELPPIEQSGTSRDSSPSDDGLGDLDLGAFDLPAPAAPSFSTTSPAPAEAAAFDFNLDLDGPTKRVEPIRAEPAPAPSSSSSDDLSFDFNFDLDAPAPAPSPSPASSLSDWAPPAPAPAPSWAPAPTPAPAWAPAPVAAAPAPAAFEPSTLDLPDFNFDADIKPIEKVSFESVELQPALVTSQTSDLSEPEIIREPELPALDDPLFQSDDAVGTKLDLARAYLDMGDPDGARSMLEEVMIEGDDHQQTEARELLSRLG